MIRCRCGAENARDLRTCSDCGAPLALSQAAAGPVPAPEADAQATLVMAELLSDEPGSEPRSASEEARTVVTPAPSPRVAPQCRACGKAVESAWRFCKDCGTPLGQEAVATARHALAHASEDGRFGRPLSLREGRSVIGRLDGELVYPDDRTLSSRHAALLVSGSTCELVDLESTNGTFVAVRRDEPVEGGDVLLLGSSRLLLRRSLLGLELAEVLPGGNEGRRLRLSGTRVLLGSDSSCDFALHDDDGVSRRHAEILRGRRGWFVRDLGSTNRTYLILKERRPLGNGDRFRVGAQIFEYRRLG